MESLSILLFLAPALCTSFARLRSRIRRLVSPPLDIRTIHTSSYPTTANVDVLLGFCAITVTVLEDNLILVLRFYLTLLLNAFIEVTRIGPIGIVLVRTEHMTWVKGKKGNGAELADGREAAAPFLRGNLDRQRREQCVVALGGGGVC